jgi:hypothetical protein
MKLDILVRNIHVNTEEDKTAIMQALDKVIAGRYTSMEVRVHDETRATCGHLFWKDTVHCAVMECSNYINKNLEENKS